MMSKSSPAPRALILTPKNVKISKPKLEAVGPGNSWSRLITTEERYQRRVVSSPVQFSCRWGVQGSKTRSREKGRCVSKPTNVIVRLSLVSLTSLTWFSVDLQFIQGWELTMSVDKKLCKSCLFWHILILSPKLVCKSVELDLTLQSHWLVGLHTEIAQR